MNERQVRQLFVRCARFLDQFSGCFGRRAQQHGAERYVRGLLSSKPRKAMTQIADALESTPGYQALQHFITHSPWDAEAIWRRLRRLAPPGPGLLLLDDTGFPKQGKYSVGVSRQYSGTFKRVGNCQLAVSAAWVRDGWRWPLGMSLYLPEEWANDVGRRERAEIPARVRFREKWRLALELVDRARKANLAIEAVVADGDYGRIAALRRALRKRGLRYVLAVHEDLTFVVEGRPDEGWFSAAEWAILQPRRAWKRIRWRDGTKGPLEAEFLAVRVHTRALGGRARREPTQWLLCERSGTVSPVHKYFLSTLSPETPLRDLVAIAHGRWQIERVFQDFKEEVALDQFQGLSWPAWNHHVALAALTFALLEQERHRRGVGRETFPMARRLLGASVFLAMLASDHASVRTLMALQRDPPHFGFT